MACDDTCLENVRNVTSDILYKEASIQQQWILFRSPYPIILVTVSYLLFVLKYGPLFMKSREPYKLKTVLRVYNILQVIINTGMLVVAFSNSLKLRCMAAVSCSLDGPDLQLCYEQFAMMFVNGTWWYIVMKIIDLFDTVFIVLKKSDKQISFLHVYHHVSMVFCTWLSAYVSLKVCQGVIPGLINVFVHAVMYSYYFIATFPRWKAVISPWKRYLTMLQLGQFVVILLYFIAVYMNNCHMPRPLIYIWTLNVFVILLLFLNFYNKTYTQTKVPTVQDEKHKTS